MDGRNLPHLRPTDVLLASYPRSGNTWMMNLLYCLDVLVLEGYVDDIQHANGPHDLPKRSYEKRLGLRLLLERTTPGTVSPARVIKTHALPAMFEGRFRAIYLFRDGRDSIWSYYHYARRFEAFAGDFPSFLRHEFYRPASAWAEHTAAWLELAASGTVLPVRYEDLLREPVQGLTQAARFLGLPDDPDRVAAAAETCRFENLQATERTALPPGEVPFYRAGKEGQWRQAYSAEDLELVLRDAGAMLARLGYSG